MEPKTADELRAHYAAVKQRLNSPKKIVDPYYSQRPDHTVRVGKVVIPKFGRILSPEHRALAVVTEADWGMAMDDAIATAWTNVAPTIPGFHAVEALRKEVIARSAKEFMVTVEELMGKRRTAWLVRARQITMVRLYTTGRYSAGEIGRRFNRDHTTVLHAIKKFQRGKLCTLSEARMRPD